ncbi:MAG: hypothetical protein JZD41_02320 [Thermoproteus sp.]|nr:hypothetical protein [Thermoproteus sp.]
MSTELASKVYSVYPVAKPLIITNDKFTTSIGEVVSPTNLDKINEYDVAYIMPDVLQDLGKILEKVNTIALFAPLSTQNDVPCIINTIGNSATVIDVRFVEDEGHVVIAKKGKHKPYKIPSVEDQIKRWRWLLINGVKSVPYNFVVGHTIYEYLFAVIQSDHDCGTASSMFGVSLICARDNTICRGGACAPRTQKPLDRGELNLLFNYIMSKYGV